MKKIGLVTAGGDAPGMNAAIRSVVRSAIYMGLEVIGFERGYAGLIHKQWRPMTMRSVSGIINLGGTILRTVRCAEMETREGIERAAENLKDLNVDGLVAIGGDGTFRGAVELQRVSGVSVIGIPATIDNDVAGTDSTIGFDTAVNTAVSAIDKIRDTATSHERIFVVEVMGRRRGFLALEVGLAGGAELILIPEVKFDLDEICERLRMGLHEGKTSQIIVAAEGVGSTSEIANYIAKETQYQVRLTVLGYVQRGGSPSAVSRILACEFGHLAVQLLLNGEKERLVRIKDGKIGSMSLYESTRQVKEIDLEKYRLAHILSL
ncbi:MAG: 6-phosphofructokinase [Candidatus Bathyarchaeota archaeon]|nr:6-phosphofructokinase [Candidatus Bathyarchaeota archaeon]